MDGSDGADAEISGNDRGSESGAISRIDRLKPDMGTLDARARFERIGA